MGRARRRSTLTPRSRRSTRIPRCTRRARCAQALVAHLFASGAREEALNHALLGVKHGRDWEDGRAKETAVKLFDAMGKSPADAQLVSKARRRLSNLLFA